MTRYILSPAAYADLVEILDYLEGKSASSAKSIEEDFIQAFELLAERPYLGHVREDFKDLPVRFWPVYSYLCRLRSRDETFTGCSTAAWRKGHSPRTAFEGSGVRDSPRCPAFALRLRSG